MRLAAGAFIAGAASRLLPPSIPFRFFGAAVAYQLLAWIALFVGAQGVPRFSGGLGWPLAALHLVTLGVLVMTAIGASLQLLPVATRRPVPSKWWPALIWWLYTPGVAAVAVGMGVPAPPLLAGGAIAVLAALGGFAWILARNLVGARGMPVVVAHGWGRSSWFSRPRCRWCALIWGFPASGEACRSRCTSPLLLTVLWDCLRSGCRTSWSRCLRYLRRQMSAAQRCR
jgi:hypothetical protein